MASALAQGKEPPASLVNGEIDNGLESVPSVLLEPVAVTVDNINDTIIKDQFWSVDEICAGKYAPPARRRVSSSWIMRTRRRPGRRRDRVRVRKEPQEMNANPPVLALKGVSKRFGPVQALSDVDFEIHDGEVVALVGDNGAGKSTMVKAIAGIHGADDGQILFEGKEVKIADRLTPRTSASRPSTRTSPLRQPRRRREPLPGSETVGTGRPRSDGRDLDGEANRRAAPAARGHDHQRARGGRHDVRGSASRWRSRARCSAIRSW